jgi:hypothetical protein
MRAMKTSLLVVACVVCVVAIVSFLGVIATPVAQAQVSFFTPPTYAGNAPIFVADFNGDGKSDILASDGTLNLGNGDGTFTTSTPVTGNPLAVADFNGDGKPDVLEQGTGTLLVLLGNGDGTFQPPIITNSGAMLGAITAGDLNGDGKADVLGLFNNNLVVYLSKGNGAFAPGVSYPVGNTSFAAAEITLGDFNGDRKVDVAVSLAGDVVVGEEVVLLGNGDGTLQSGKISTGVYYPTSVVAGDFNNDGKLDLVIAGQPSCNGTCTPATTSILLGNGDGTFQSPTTVFSNNGTLVTADLNGDGKLDLVLLNGVVEVYLGKGDGTFSNTHSYQPLGGSPGLAVADFNLDGKLDIAAGNVLLSNGDGTFKGVSGVALSLPEFGPPATVVGAFNKNGTPSVAVLSTNSMKNLYILTNDETGALSLAHTYTLQQPGYGIATADLNGDGNLDLIVTGVDPISQDWSYSVLLGKGDGTFQLPLFYPQNVSAGAPAIVIADFNNDHKPDFVVTAGNSVAVLLGKGDGTFGAPAYFFDGGGGSIVSADFNGDGNRDIAAAGLTGLAILLGNGDGTFQPATFPFTTPFNALLTADVNGDGKADLVDSQPAQVYLGNGDGAFQAPIPIGQTFPPAVVSVLADINRDGKPDVIGGRQFSAQGQDRGLFLGNGDGTFGPYILLPYVPSSDNSTNFVQAADMNGDGKQDLIVADAYSIFVLINTTVPVPGASFSPTSVTFASQAVGTISNPTPVMLTNTGAVALTVKTVSFGGVDAGEFNQTSNCTTVEPLESCTINVSFAPTATGGSSANLMVADNAGTGLQQVVVSGTGAAAADFGIGPASGSSNSATITAGQTASFNLAVSPGGAFSGVVSLSCAITPAVTPAPVCTVPASVNVTQGTDAAVTAKISTSAAATAGSISSVNSPPGATAIQWTIVLLASSLLFAGYRRRKPALAIPMIAVFFFGLAACGGGSSSSQTPGTPAGTYTATVTAKSGNLSHNTPLTVIVQ